MIELAQEKPRFGYRRLLVLIRVLGVVGTFTRECLALEVDTSFASRRVTRVLDEVILAARTPAASAHGQRQRTDLAAFPKPVQNANVERFNGKLRDECLSRLGRGSGLTCRPTSVPRLTVGAARTLVKDPGGRRPPRPNARQNCRSSITSIRRSPRSHLLMNDCVSPKRST